MLINIQESRYSEEFIRDVLELKNKGQIIHLTEEDELFLKLKYPTKEARYKEEYNNRVVFRNTFIGSACITTAKIASGIITTTTEYRR